MAGEMKPIDPNAMIYMAKALRQGQKIPVVGDALFGDAAQSAEDIAYGFFPGKGSGMTTQLDPGVADLAGYASSVPGIAAKLLRKGGSAVARAVGSGAVNVGRREAMKKIGKGAAVATAAAGTGKVIDDLLPAIAKHTESLALPTGKAVVRQFTGRDLINDFLKYANDPSTREWMSSNLDEYEKMGLDLNRLDASQLEELVSKYGEPTPGVVERLYGVGEQPLGSGLFNDVPSEGIDEALMAKWDALSPGEREDLFIKALWKGEWPDEWAGLRGIDLEDEPYQIMNKFDYHPEYKEAYMKSKGLK